MNRHIFKISIILLVCLFSSTTKAASWPDQISVTLRFVKPMNGTYYMDNYGFCDFSMNFDINGTYLLSKVSENKWIYTDPDPNKQLTRTCPNCNQFPYYCGTWNGFVIEVTKDISDYFQILAHPLDYNAAYFLGSGQSIDFSTTWSIPFENGFQSPSVFEGGYLWGIGSYGGDALISWDGPEPSVYGDINGDGLVNEDDFLTVIRDIYTGNPRSEGLFSGPYINILDVYCYDWWYNLLTERNYPFYLLPMVSLSPDDGYPAYHSPPADLGLEYDFVILAKCGGTAPGSKMKNALFPLRGKPFFDVNGKEEFYPEQGNMKLKAVVSPVNNSFTTTVSSLYVFNSRSGISRLGTPSEIVVPPAKFNWPSEPVYGHPATIYVGIQERWIPVPDTTYEIPNIYGRPILDADFHTESYFDRENLRFNSRYVAYIAPVVVRPIGILSYPPFVPEPYEAAAKIILEPGSNPPYSIEKLYVPEYVYYDEKVLDVVMVADYLDREVGVIMLTTYGATKIENSGFIKSIYLPHYPVAIERGIGYGNYGVLVACSGGNGLSYVYYLDSALFDDSFPMYPPYIINDMSYVTDIAAGGKWVVGFSFSPDPPPENPVSSSPPFYSPKMAKLGSPFLHEPEEVNAIDLYVSPYTYDIALPLSIARFYSPSINHGNYDYSGDGIINFIDYAYWSNQSYEAAFLTCIYWLETWVDWLDVDF